MKIRHGIISIPWQIDLGSLHTGGSVMPYLRDNDQHRSAFGEPPVVVNYFYHEEVKKSAKKGKE